jgi:hypothetical protein
VSCKKRKFLDDHDRIYARKRKLAESRFQELQRRLIYDQQYLQELQETEKEFGEFGGEKV